MVHGPIVEGACWDRTLGFKSSLVSDSVCVEFKTFSLSSMLAFMLDFSTVVSSVPEMQSLGALNV